MFLVICSFLCEVSFVIAMHICFSFLSHLRCWNNQEWTKLRFWMPILVWLDSSFWTYIMCVCVYFPVWNKKCMRGGDNFWIGKIYAFAWLKMDRFGGVSLWRDCFVITLRLHFSNSKIIASFHFSKEKTYLFALINFSKYSVVFIVKKKRTQCLML